MRPSILIALAAVTALPFRVLLAQADDSKVTLLRHDEVSAAFARGVPLVEVGDY